MFGDIARFLIEVVSTLFGVALLVRAWMQGVRLPISNPLSQGVRALTDWFVLPVRRVLRPAGAVDVACLFGAWLTALIYLLLVLHIAGFDTSQLFPGILVAALLVAVKWGISMVVWATLIMAVLSWVNPRSPMMAILDYLLAPLLAPIRRILPQLGGIDLSPLVLLVIAQVISMVLTRLAALVVVGGL